MKCMKKRKDFIFRLLVSFFVILYAGLIVKQISPDSDMYFLAATGREIVEHGFIKLNPFCLDEGMYLIIQQWLSAVIDYAIMEYFGTHGFFCLGVFYMVLHSISVLWMLRDYTRSRWGLLMGYLLCSFISFPFYTTRGNIVTSCVLCLMLHALYQFAQKKKKRYLFTLIFASLFVINFQAAAWPFLFVYILPYLIPDGVMPYVCGFLAEYKREGRTYYLPLFGTMLGMFACGFVNPYGADAVMYLYYSSGSLSSIVAEHNALRISDFHLWPVFLFFTATVIYLCIFKMKSSIRLTMLTLGSLCFSIMLSRNGLYAIYAAGPLLLCLRKFGSTPQWEEVRYHLFPKTIYGFQKMAGILILFSMYFIYSIPGAPYNRIKDGTMDTAYTPLTALNCLEEYPGKARVWSDFNNGGFFEWYGYQVFLDARPEIYQKRMNRKKDIFSLYERICQGTADYEDILQEYRFTHVYANFASPLYYYMNGVSDYESIMTEDAVKKAGYQFYVKKE